MKKIKLLLLALVIVFTTGFAIAFTNENQSGTSTHSTDQAKIMGGGTHGGTGGGTTTGGTTTGGTGSTGGTTTGGTTTGGTTTGGTTTGGTTTGGTTTGGTTTGGTTTGGTTTGGTTTGGTTTGGTGSTGGTTTGGNDVGCVRTQGYWGSSPAGQARLIELIGTTGMDLGTQHYTAAQIDAILDMPAGGNALTILAQQLIAAKLNILNGASSTPVASDISMADSLIGNLRVGVDSVSPSSTLGQQMLQVKDKLDSYNNGNEGVPHCN